MAYHKASGATAVDTTAFSWCKQAQGSKLVPQHDCNNLIQLFLRNETNNRLSKPVYCNDSDLGSNNNMCIPGNSIELQLLLHLLSWPAND